MGNSNSRKENNSGSNVERVTIFRTNSKRLIQKFLGRSRTQELMINFGNMIEVDLPVPNDVIKEIFKCVILVDGISDIFIRYLKYEGKNWLNILLTCKYIYQLAKPVFLQMYQEQVLYVYILGGYATTPNRGDKATFACFDTW